MTYMTNSDIVKNYPKQDTLNMMLREKNAAMRELNEAIVSIKDQLTVLENVHEVYEGVALRKSEFGDTVIYSAVDPRYTTRSAEINSENNLTTYIDAVAGQGEINHGCDWCEPESLQLVAKRWVVFGERPNSFG